MGRRSSLHCARKGRLSGGIAFGNPVSNSSAINVEKRYIRPPRIDKHSMIRRNSGFLIVVGLCNGG
jgi:hypothetical protein